MNSYCSSVNGPVQLEIKLTVWAQLFTDNPTLEYFLLRTGRTMVNNLGAGELASLLEKTIEQLVALLYESSAKGTLGFESVADWCSASSRKLGVVDHVDSTDIAASFEDPFACLRLVKYLESAYIRQCLILKEMGENSFHTKKLIQQKGASEACILLHSKKRRFWLKVKDFFAN